LFHLCPLKKAMSGPVPSQRYHVRLIFVLPCADLLRKVCKYPHGTPP
jgi:hypothetical protein